MLFAYKIKMSESETSSEAGEEESYPKLVLATANSMREKGQLTDVTLNARGREFKAHRLILASGSLFFERLFLGGYREATQPVLQRIYGQMITFDLLDFEIQKALVYFGAKQFDPERDISELDVPEHLLKEYVNFADTVYPEGIPMNIIDHIASMIKSRPIFVSIPGVPILSELPPPDISFLSDEFITLLLSSPDYQPRNIQEIYDLIKGLVEKGHSPELLSLINYDLIPQEMKENFTQDFLGQYNRGGPLPRLTTIQELMSGYTYAVLMIVKIPKQIEGNSHLYRTRLQDASGKIWEGEVSTYVTFDIGEIIKGNVIVESPTAMVRPASGFPGVTITPQHSEREYIKLSMS